MTRVFFNNSKLASEVEYVNGSKEGIDNTYYENGNIKHKGQNKLGVKTGPWYYFSEVGDLKKNGKLGKRKTHKQQPGVI